MATYRAVATSETDPLAPIIAQLMKALEMNPRAIAEGATGAPIMQSAWHPYDAVTYGDGNTGRLWSFAVDGVVTLIESPVFTTGFEYRLIVQRLLCSSATSELQIDAYRETTASYTAFVSGHVVGSTDRLSFNAEFAKAMQADYDHFIEMTGNKAADSNAAGALAWAINGKRGVRTTTEQRISRVRMQCLVAGTFTGGAVYLEKRLIANPY